VSISRRSETLLALVSLALLSSGAAKAEGENVLDKKVDSAAEHAAGPSKIGTPANGGVPYASAPDTATPGVTPKVPAKSTTDPKTGLPEPNAPTTPEGASGVPSGAASQAGSGETKPVDPALPGTTLPGDGQTTPTSEASPVAPAQSTTSAATPAKTSPSNGKPQISVQMPSHKQLGPLLRINEPAARIRIKTAEARCRNQLRLGGMDSSITIDQAMALGKPVINIYCRKTAADNILTHGFCLEAFLVQYQRKPSGRVETTRYVRLGESDAVYSGADFEDKAVKLVDVYLSAVRHQQRDASAAAKKGKTAGKGKRTK
jgi:hypothetical protein